MNQGDISYENVIDIKGDEIIFEPEIKLIKSQKGVIFTYHVSKHKCLIFYFKQESELIEIKTEIVFEWCYNKVLIKIVATEFGLESQKIRNIFYEFKAWWRLSKNSANRKINGEKSQ